MKEFFDRWMINLTGSVNRREQVIQLLVVIVFYGTLSWYLYSVSVGLHNWKTVPTDRDWRPIPGFFSGSTLWRDFACMLLLTALSVVLICLRIVKKTPYKNLLCYAIFFGLIIWYEHQLNHGYRPDPDDMMDPHGDALLTALNRLSRA